MATKPSASGKDTVYIDIDDEITSIIEKVRGSSDKIVALVLPKRASVFQSIVNMKLLKRSAEEAKKHIVLITSEAGLMPLAATVGLHVAKTPSSKPEIPSLSEENAADAADDSVDIDSDEADEVTAATAGSTAIGDLAGTSAVAAAASDEVETLDMDTDEPESSDAATKATAAAGGGKAAKSAKNKKLRIPNFDRFRLRLFLGILGVILLIVLLYLANSVLPKATITLTTDSSTIDSNLTVNLDTTVKTLDTTQLILPATSQSVQKSASQQVPTTGQKNEGQQATGTITMSGGSCTGTVPADVPQGSGVSSNSLTYITGADVSFVPTVSHGKCVFQGETSGGGTNIGITAQSGGANYNVSSAATFTVAGRSDVSASGTASGGTDNIIKTVAQADIASATQKITAADTSSIQTGLQQQLQQAGWYAVTATFAAGTPASSNSANVGDQASTVTVTQVTTYTMLGVKESDLKTLVDANVKGQIDPTKQTILDEGLSNATFRLISTGGNGAQLQLSTIATAGPDLSVAAIQSQVGGKKAGDIETTLTANPGVTAVKVHLSPFWVTTAPKKASKVTVIFDKSNTTTKSNASQ